jgi:dihydroorotate dehydrogenase
MYRRFVYPLLARLEPEAAHELALRLLPAAKALGPILQIDDPRLRVSAFGLDFPNPLGLAAGFDKNGVAVEGLAGLGFGHIEVGTVTPRPQPGRPQPRLFRLTEDHALINRLGFPSRGAAAVAANLRRLNKDRRFVLGVNVGPNAGSVGVDDFVLALNALEPLADYLTLNVSSPNTAGLRGMQQSEALAELLQAVGSIERPLLVKIAPDLSDAELDALLDVVLAHRVAGVVATNTTMARPASLKSAYAAEAGGLSGLPLRDRATEVIRHIRQHAGVRLPVIGVGGIATAAGALDKLRAGASLLQLYTGFVYAGPLAARAINLGLIRELDRLGLRTVGDLAGLSQ